jgi:hypothetical protein
MKSFAPVRNAAHVFMPKFGFRDAVASFSNRQVWRIAGIAAVCLENANWWQNNRVIV